MTAELPGEGHDHLAVDLASAEGLRSTAATLSAAAIPYDLLVNNAGCARPPGPFGAGPTGGTAPLDEAAPIEGASSIDETLSIDGARPMLRLNCEAVVILSHAFLGAARPGAALVNVASALAFTPQPGQAVYGATKAFVTSFSQALWYEQRPRGIHVLALCPGPTATRPGLHADTPSVLVHTLEAVVAAALRALRRRSRHTVLPGLANTFLTRTLAALPRRTSLAVLAGT
ncbi:SDR family NAD(P)-dependent oxidoreductase [Streptomyces sp. NPDC046876]|uniref:SDR family NAD(P)-dependent oxidoreductase n=1 Tax=Streptomyces sp. NPDC046876 TaxID=3155616 RepID=UPI0033C6EAD9